MKSLRNRVCAAAVGVWVLVCTADLHAQQSSLEKTTKSAADKNVDPLAVQVKKAIDTSSRRYLEAGTHTPWQIMHGLLAFRQDYIIKQNGKKIRAIDWIAGGASYGHESLFEATQHGGRAHPYSQPYVFEGHANQFFAILSMSDPPMHFKLKAGDRTITVADLVKHAQMEVHSSEELTWTFWALCRYLSPDTRWTNQWGETWSIERLVQAENDASLHDAVCGGTHRLFALCCARDAYQKTGRPLQGVWLDADRNIRRHVEIARSLQNTDGTFSSNYFQGGGAAYDFETRCDTSGHTLEFLMAALPTERLKEQWVRNGVHAVSKGLIEHSSEPIRCGPLYHALGGLVMYHKRTQPKVVVDTPVVETDETDQKTGTKSQAESSTAKTKAEKKQAADKPKQAEMEPKLAVAEAKRAEADQKLIVAKTKRDEADGKRAGVDAIRAELKQAEVEARRADAEAAQAETEAQSTEAEAQEAEKKAKAAAAASEKQKVDE